MTNDTKYGRITASNKEIPDGEPVFLLRAQDRFAAAAVRFYASMLEGAGYDEGITAEIREFADKMRAWPVKKIPD